MVDILNAFMHTDNEKDKDGDIFITKIRGQIVNTMVTIDPEL